MDEVVVLFLDGDSFGFLVLDYDELKVEFIDKIG